MQWYEKALLTLGIAATTGAANAQKLTQQDNMNGINIENVAKTDLTAQDKAISVKFKQLVNQIASMPEIEINEKTDQDGRQFVDKSNRWHSIREISKDGKPLYTTVTTVYDNDNVVGLDYNHSTGKFEDSNGQELSPEKIAEKMANMEQGIKETEKFFGLSRKDNTGKSDRSSNTGKGTLQLTPSDFAKSR